MATESLSTEYCIRSSRGEMVPPGGINKVKFSCSSLRNTLKIPIQVKIISVILEGVQLSGFAFKEGVPWTTCKVAAPSSEVSSSLPTNNNGSIQEANSIIGDSLNFVSEESYKYLIWILLSVVWITMVQIGFGFRRKDPLLPLYVLPHCKFVSVPFACADQRTSGSCTLRQCAVRWC